MAHRESPRRGFAHITHWRAFICLLVGLSPVKKKGRNLFRVFYSSFFGMTCLIRRPSAGILITTSAAAAVAAIDVLSPKITIVSPNRQFLWGEQLITGAGDRARDTTHLSLLARHFGTDRMSAGAAGFYTQGEIAVIPLTVTLPSLR